MKPLTVFGVLEFVVPGLMTLWKLYPEPFAVPVIAVMS